MPIVLLRVDERLIHGQVVVGWGEKLHMDRIVVVDDEIQGSPWEQELYCLGVPPAVEAVFVTVEEARQAFAGWRDDARRTALLVRDCQTLERLADGGTLDGFVVNLGGLHSAPGRERVLPYLFLGPSDCETLRRIADSGTRISAQDLPATRPIPLPDLLPDEK